MGFGLHAGAYVVVRHFAFGPWHTVLAVGGANITLEPSIENVSEDVKERFVKSHN